MIINIEDHVPLLSIFFHQQPMSVLKICRVGPMTWYLQIAKIRHMNKNSKHTHHLWSWIRRNLSCGSFRYKLSQNSSISCSNSYAPIGQEIWDTLYMYKGSYRSYVRLQRCYSIKIVYEGQDLIPPALCKQGHIHFTFTQY